MYVLKSKGTQNISNHQEWHQNKQNVKSLFRWRFLHCKAFTRAKKTQELVQSNHNWLVVILWKFFIRQPPVQNDLFWEVSRVVVLYRFDCSWLWVQDETAINYSGKFYVRFWLMGWGKAERGRFLSDPCRKGPVK